MHAFFIVSQWAAFLFTRIVYIVAYGMTWRFCGPRSTGVLIDRLCEVGSSPAAESCSFLGYGMHTSFLSIVVFLLFSAGFCACTLAWTVLIPVYSRALQPSQDTIQEPEQEQDLESALLALHRHRTRSRRDRNALALACIGLLSTSLALLGFIALRTSEWQDKIQSQGQDYKCGWTTFAWWTLASWSLETIWTFARVVLFKLEI